MHTLGSNISSKHFLRLLQSVHTKTCSLKSVSVMVYCSTLQLVNFCIETLLQLIIMHTDSHCNASPCSLPGLRGCPRGGGDDPRRSLCVRGAFWLRHPEHHPAHPEPYPCHATPPPYPSTRGVVLPPPQDGRLLPHLLQTEGAHIMQGHVPRSVQCLQPEEAGAAGSTGQCLDVRGHAHCLNMPRTF